MNLENAILFSWKSLNKDLEVNNRRISCQTSNDGYKTAIGEYTLRPFNRV